MILVEMVLQFVIGCECPLDTLYRTYEAEDLVLDHSSGTIPYFMNDLSWIKRDLSILE